MYEIIEAKYIQEYKIEFRFADNSFGVVDFEEYRKKNGLFESLKDINYFKNFKLDKELGTISWENGLDIAPDTLYIKATGKYPAGLDNNLY